MRTFAPITLLVFVCVCLALHTGCDEGVDDEAKVIPASAQSSVEAAPASAEEPEARERQGAGLPPQKIAKQESEPDEPEFSHPYAEDNWKWDAWCEQNVGEVEKLQAELPDSCEQDSDCRSIYLGCPMGCKIYVAKSKQADAFIEAKREFLRNCRNCRYQCHPQGLPMCADGKCQANPNRMPEPEPPKIEIIRGSDDY